MPKNFRKQIIQIRIGITSKIHRNGNYKNLHLNLIMRGHITFESLKCLIFFNNKIYSKLSKIYSKLSLSLVCVFVILKKKSKP